MNRIIVACAAALFVLAGCTSTPEPTASPTPSGTPVPSAPAGNGSLYVADQGEDTVQIKRYPIDADGDLGPVIDIMSGKTGLTSGPYVIDGIGDTVAVGQFEDYWTTAIELRDATTGRQIASVEAPRWCGGEGLTFNPCAMPDAGSLVRTSERGAPDQPDATVWVSSLRNGDDTATWGPFPHLGTVSGTTDPSVVMITVSDVEPDDPPQATPGRVESLDPATGTTRMLGTYAADWLPICPLGADAMLGWTSAGSTSVASVVGDATIGTVSFPSEERPLGCSVDGKFLYLERGGGEEPAVVTRVTLADGASTEVLTLREGQSATTVTR